MIDVDDDHINHGDCDDSDDMIIVNHLHVSGMLVLSTLEKIANCVLVFSPMANGFGM